MRTLLKQCAHLHFQAGVTSPGKVRRNRQNQKAELQAWRPARAANLTSTCMQRNKDSTLLYCLDRVNFPPKFCSLGRAVIRIRARSKSELAFADFEEFNLVAGLKSKLLPNVCGEGNPTIEGDHC